MNVEKKFTFSAREEGLGFQVFLLLCVPKIESCLVERNYKPRFFSETANKIPEIKSIGMIHFNASIQISSITFCVSVCGTFFPGKFQNVV